jgi:membrane-associated phospholipid phosphatase
MPLVLLGIVLFASWVLPPTAAWWDRVDHVVFQSFNATLDRWGDYWVHSVAWANHRLYDLTVAVLYAVLVVVYCLEGRGRRFARRAASLAVVLVALLAFRAVVGWITTTVDYRRPSPTLAVSGATRLTTLLPEVRTKDSSKASFPSDHALVAFWVGLFFWTRGARRHKLAAAGLAVLAVLPRLVGGAHWLTDVAVGGLCLALFFFGLLACTRLLEFSTRLIEPWMDRLSRPVFRRMFARAASAQ